MHLQILVLFGIASGIAMSLDDLLFAIITAGIGLSGAYLRAELLLHRNDEAADQGDGEALLVRRGTGHKRQNTQCYVPRLRPRRALP